MLRVGGGPGGPDDPKLTPAEQKIADEYTKKGFIVTKANGRLQFKKDPNFKSLLPTQSVLPQQTQSVISNPINPIARGERIPLPDYTNEESRLKYAQAFRDKYGKELLTGYGDIPLRINEKPAYSNSTAKSMILNAAKAAGVDPSLLYTSAMVEGFSGLYPGARKSLGSQGVGFTGDREYPVSANWHYGLDSLEGYLPSLIKKGYLPSDFSNTYKVWKGPTVSPAGDVNAAGAAYRPENVMFKNAEAGMQAKAAMMRQYFDEFDDYAKKKGIKLSPEQRKYFALAHFNSGAHGYEMLDSYNKAGLLKNDDFIKKMPNIDVSYRYQGKPMSREASMRLHKQIYGNVAPRLAAARGLTEEGLFDEAQPDNSKIMVRVAK